jgi:outer membrane protein TolC
MAEHAFGLSFGMRLPWLWGSRAGSEQAAAGRSRALGEELAVKKRDLALELLEAKGAVAAAHSSLSVLKARVLPATQRARQLAQAAYQSGQGRLEDVLRAEAQQVETEMQIVELESELAHRKADLAFALGSVQRPARSATENNHDR